MKVVVFAHTPPPHHGQSHMVEQMLRGFADGLHDVETFHVNARFASDIQDIGKFRAAKALRLLRYCMRALWYRFRRGAGVLYYIPAPPLKNAVARDWAVLLLCRPFFSKTILHWHASGLARWIKDQPRWVQILTHRALDGADLSIALTEFNKTECEEFSPKKTLIVPNGIPDPCGDFEKVFRARRERVGAKGPRRVRVLYMGLGLEEKGIFDAMEGVFRANKLAIEGNFPFRFSLTIAGKFFDEENEEHFRRVLKEAREPETIQHVGFVEGMRKAGGAARRVGYFLFPDLLLRGKSADCAAGGVGVRTADRHHEMAGAAGIAAEGLPGRRGNQIAGTNRGGVNHAGDAG
jgi:glycosyltransferase involved in cell wall biosynthesis